MPESSEQTPKTYVYQETEVKLTGRTAKRAAGGKASRRTPKTTTEQVVYEITPAEIENGSWKKWVRMAELYEIE